MKFRSPLINIFGPEEDHLKLISAPQHYFSMKLKFDRWGNNAGGDYPICKLDNIYLHFNHYHSKSMRELEEKWYDRVSRINYNNIFAIMYTENKSSLENFVKLPHTKKVCFVSFENSYQCSSTLRNANKKSNESFWRVVNSIPQGKYNEYDVISGLNSGIIRTFR